MQQAVLDEIDLATDLSLDEPALHLARTQAMLFAAIERVGIEVDLPEEASVAARIVAAAIPSMRSVSFFMDSNSLSCFSNLKASPTGIDP